MLNIYLQIIISLKKYTDNIINTRIFKSLFICNCIVYIIDLYMFKYLYYYPFMARAKSLILVFAIRLFLITIKG